MFKKEIPKYVVPYNTALDEELDNMARKAGLDPKQFKRVEHEEEIVRIYIKPEEDKCPQ